VGIGVVFAGAVVMVILDRLMRREFLQPDLVIVVEAALVIVNEDARGLLRWLAGVFSESIAGRFSKNYPRLA